MGYIIKILTNTFKETTVGTLNYSFNATNLIEKLCWFLMWWVATLLVSVALCAVGLFSRGFWLRLGEVVPLRGVFGCLLVGFTYLLNHLGCSLGGLVCFFIDPVWFLPGFGWLPLRVLKVCVKSFQCSDVSLHVDDARWTWVASLLYEVSTYACLFFPAKTNIEKRNV